MLVAREDSRVHSLSFLLHRLRDSISGDVEENPGSFIQINNDKNAPCVKQVNSVSLLESKLSELGRISVNVLGEGNCFFMRFHASYITPLRIICIYVLLEFRMFFITLSCI